MFAPEAWKLRKLNNPGMASRNGLAVVALLATPTTLPAIDPQRALTALTRDRPPSVARFAQSAPKARHRLAATDAHRGQAELAR